MGSPRRMDGGCPQHSAPLKASAADMANRKRMKRDNSVGFIGCGFLLVLSARERQAAIPKVEAACQGKMV